MTTQSIAQPAPSFTIGQSVTVLPVVRFFGGQRGVVKRHYADCGMYAVSLPVAACPDVTAVNFYDYELAAVTK